jgi:16S rRNA (guanine966-N2)-methyltransferase
VPPKNRGGPSQGQVRIIGGRWRGRKLYFSASVGLRPTPDRVRETLFNWLQPVIVGARCLDLFAGSGALGLEALSRGAAQVVMVEQEPRACQAIRAHLEGFSAEGAELVTGEALAFLQRSGQAFDIVFLDPPFASALLEPCCERLESGGWLAAEAHIYLEARGGDNLPPLPPRWQRMRSKRSGEVGYYLAHRR